MELIKSIKSLSHKYDKKTEYQHVAYHTLLCHFMIFRQGGYRNSELKQRFKEQIMVLEAYNRDVLFGNIPGATAQEIAMLVLDVDIEGDVEKAHVSESGKYLATAFLLSSDRRWYSELILSLKMTT